MSMSDCIHCWDTPCTCGYEYRNYSIKGRIALAAAVLGIDKDKLSELINKYVPENHPLKEKTNGND